VPRLSLLPAAVRFASGKWTCGGGQGGITGRRLISRCVHVQTGIK